MTDLTLEGSQGVTDEPLIDASVEMRLAFAADALEPFARALAAMPADIRCQPDRNLADILGIFTADLPRALTVGDLARAAAAFAIVSTIPKLWDAAMHLSRETIPVTGGGKS